MGTRTPIRPVNLAVLVGTVTKPPRYRTFESAPSITSFDVKIRRDEKVTDVVRVTWFDAPTSALEIEEGETIAVCGRVRRYWFNGNQSVTDVVADTVVTRATAGRTRRAIGSVLSALEEVVA